LRPIEEGGVMGGTTVAASWHGGGEKRGGAHGAVAWEEGEAALDRREEEEGRVATWAERPNGLAGCVGREAEWSY
jgi:hypothetical protein